LCTFKIPGNYFTVEQRADLVAKERVHRACSSPPRAKTKEIAKMSHGNDDHRQIRRDGDPRRDWKAHGVKVVPGSALDANTAQTPGMSRSTAINRARAGAEKLWAGKVLIKPNAKTGAHHHGELESVIFVLNGRARMRWGENLEYMAEAGPGDFIYVPPYVPHQEINASREEALECVLVRSGQEPVVVNLDIDPIEAPEEVLWKDAIHR
jgi:uncharacterized RmlC-like cupin family protein